MGEFTETAQKWFSENHKIEPPQLNNNETPEDIFSRYEEKREISDLQKLWNLGIHLHEIRGNQWTMCNYFETWPEQSVIKLYDMIDGEIKFTKKGYMKLKNNVGDLPLMKKCCKTCPFKENKDGKWQDQELANKVISRTLFKASQICHTTEDKNRKANNRCKGAFDHNETIYKRIFGIGFDDYKRQNSLKYNK